MESVTLTVFNQRPSEVMKMVAAGQVVKITRRGVPVARLVPEPKAQNPINLLVDAGLLVAPSDPRPLPAANPRATVAEVRAALEEINSDTSV